MYNGWGGFQTTRAQIGANKVVVKCRNLPAQALNRIFFYVKKNKIKRLSKQRWTHLIVSGALGLRDELGIADVTVAFGEQASIHHTCRLHLHLGLNKQTQMSFECRGKWNYSEPFSLCEWWMHIQTSLRNRFAPPPPPPEWQIWDDSLAQNMLIPSVRTSSHGWFWMQSWIASGSHFSFCILP